jgi:hypothetical protein
VQDLRVCNSFAVQLAADVIMVNAVALGSS